MLFGFAERCSTLRLPRSGVVEVLQQEPGPGPVPVAHQLGREPDSELELELGLQAEDRCFGCPLEPVLEEIVHQVCSAA